MLVIAFLAGCFVTIAVATTVALMLYFGYHGIAFITDRLPADFGWRYDEWR